MTNPLDNFKKLRGRSLKELKTRGAQKLDAYRGKMAPPKVPTGEAFHKLLDPKFFRSEKPSAGELATVLYRVAAEKFFPVFEDAEESADFFRNRFRGRPVANVMERANRTVEGRLDVLGHRELDFGAAVDWRVDPVSGKRSELKHWSLFDDLASDETGDLKVVWEANRHQHFFALGIAYLLTQEEHYAATFARHLESWIEQNPPELGVNWISSLELSFRAVSWIWALNLFRGSFNLQPALVEKMVQHLYLHGLHIEKHLSTYYSANTHLTGEALGLYYLGTQLPFLKKSAKWRKLGEEILLRELDRQLHPDGVYFEQSTWYQRYTADYYIQYLILRGRQSGKPFELPSRAASAKIQSMVEFLMHVMRPDGTTPMVGDDDGGRCLPHGSNRSDDFRAVLSTCSVVFNRGDFKWAAGQMLEETFWLLGRGGADAYEKLRAVSPERSSAAFKDGGYFVMRDGSSETDNFLLVDCGELGSLNGAHGHSDALSIEVAVAGRTMLVDPGTYTYHESEEIRDYFRSTEAHNTLSVDGKSQSVPDHKFAWKTKAKADLKSWVSEERFDYFEGAHDGYERLDDPVKHSRGILFLKNEYWIVRDFALATRAHEYALNFHYNIGTRPVLNRLNDSWAVDETPATGTGLRLITMGDNGGWQLKESWISRNHGERVNAPLMRFASKGEGPQEFFTFMLPIEEGFNPPEVTERLAMGGRAFTVQFRGYRDIVTFCDTEAGIESERFKTDFKFGWTRLSYSGSPEEFVLIDGKKLVLDGSVIIDEPTPIPFASIRILGNRANVRTAVSVYSIPLLPSNV